ncbi:hypothetical protein LZ32DRAFT_459979 [Colletotrichum eremochloae]|nr:hypothetical protein LZ32DRAFT_459979 [Colletotrichum eremochloae]
MMQDLDCGLSSSENLDQDLNEHNSAPAEFVRIEQEPRLPKQGSNDSSIGKLTISERNDPDHKDPMPPDPGEACTNSSSSTGVSKTFRHKTSRIKGHGGSSHGKPSGSNKKVVQISVWYCHACLSGPYSTTIDMHCPNCRHQRCAGCTTDIITQRSHH